MGTTPLYTAAGWGTITLSIPSHGSRSRAGEHEVNTKKQRKDQPGDPEVLLNEAASGCFSIPSAYQSFLFCPSGGS